jgi:hypothetical protein
MAKKKKSKETENHSSTVDQEIFDYIKNIPEDEFTPYPSQKYEYSIDDEIARKQSILNRGLEQDIALKRLTLLILFIFLGLETVCIFVFAYFQATGVFGFKLDEWSFKLLIAATISQITYMLQVAVKHLFPVKK